MYHDAVIATAHWEWPHNKFLYAWDHADLLAMLRGQAPLLDLTYAGEKGTAGRVPVTVTDDKGNAWSSRWTDVKDRVKRTYDTVCAWQSKVALLEMIDHHWLTSDRSVQVAEFSGDGGTSGQGIVIHFGAFDGRHGVSGEPWHGAVRGNSISVKPGEFQMYQWGPAKGKGR